MKKYLVALLIIVCAVFCAIGVSACVPDGLEAHNWSEVWESNASQHWRRCLDAGCNGRTDRADHEWEVNEVYKAPTCGETGTGQYICNVCGATMGSETSPATIPATGEHSWELMSVDAEPTCGQEGTGTYLCEVCGAGAVFPVPATGNHDYSGSYITTEEGHYHACLNGCGVDEELQPHVEGEPITYEPAGTLDGRIEYRCVDCNYLISKEVIPNPDVLYRFDVRFVKNGTRIIPVMREDGEIYIALAVSDNPASGYRVEFEGFKLDGGSIDVPNVRFYFYDEVTDRKQIIDMQHGPDETTGYLGYSGYEFGGELVEGSFWISRSVTNVSLIIESTPSGREPISLKIHVSAGSLSATSLSVKLPVPDTVPVYYMDKKVNV